MDKILAERSMWRCEGVRLMEEDHLCVYEEGPGTSCRRIYGGGPVTFFMDLAWIKRGEMRICVSTGAESVPIFASIPVELTDSRASLHAILQETLQAIRDMRTVQRAVLAHVGFAENIARMVVEMLQ